MGLVGVASLKGTKIQFLAIFDKEYTFLKIERNENYEIHYQFSKGCNRIVKNDIRKKSQNLIELYNRGISCDPFPCMGMAIHAKKLKIIDLPGHTKRKEVGNDYISSRYQCEMAVVKHFSDYEKLTSYHQVEKKNYFIRTNDRRRELFTIDSLNFSMDEIEKHLESGK